MQQELLANKLNKLHEALSHIEHQIKKTMQYVDELRKDSERKDYSDIPGTLGQFDGLHMVAQDGQKYEVPANYAAKSRLVFGDKLKMIQENGANVFKLIDKVPREKIDGIVTRKDGKWYVLSPAGSYKISDTAAEFNKLNVNDEIQALLPKGNYTTPYAAFDKLNKGINAPAPTSATTSAPAAPKPAVQPAKPIQTVSAAPTPVKKVETATSRPRPAPKAATQKPAPAKPKKTYSSSPAAPAEPKKQPVNEQGTISLGDNSDNSGKITSLEDFDLR